MTNPPFSGFPPSLFHFRKTLTANNNRAWFQQHKSRYEAELLAPCQAFIRSFQPHLKRKDLIGVKQLRDADVLAEDFLSATAEAFMTSRVFVRFLCDALRIPS